MYMSRINTEEQEPNESQFYLFLKRDYRSNIIGNLKKKKQSGYKRFIKEMDGKSTFRFKTSQKPFRRNKRGTKGETSLRF